MIRAFVKVMKAFSEPNRVMIIKILQHGHMCVGEIQAALDIAQPTVSRHLRIFANADLVSSDRDGRLLNYFLNDGGGNPYAAVILGNLRHWLKDDPEIGRYGVVRLPLVVNDGVVYSMGRTPGE